MAPKFGFDAVMEARFATKALGAEQTGLAYFQIEPGQRQFAHRHAELAFGTPAISDGTNDAEILTGEDAACPGDPSPATS